MINSSEFIPYNKIPRLCRDIVVLEKIDGTNAQILIEPSYKIREDALVSIDGSTTFAGQSNLYYANVWAGSRSKWLKADSKQTDNHGFAEWVKSNAYQLVATLGFGRFYGEWWGQGINRGYGLIEKRFSLFNPDFKFKVDPKSLVSVVPVLYRGEFSTDRINAVMVDLAQRGSQAEKGFMKPEGIVIYHTASGHLYKRTIENDEQRKGEQSG